MDKKDNFNSMVNGTRQGAAAFLTAQKIVKFFKKNSIEEMQANLE